MGDKGDLAQAVALRLATGYWILGPWLVFQMNRYSLNSIIKSKVLQPLKSGADFLERVRYGRLWRSLISPSQTNQQIQSLLEGDLPALVSRIGHTEGRIVGEWLFRGGHHGQLTHKQAHQNAGIFPVEGSLLTRFSEIYSAALGEVDLLGFWQTSYQARWLASLPKRPLLAPLESLEPYFHPQPWSSALAGRRVLVVHPFVESITSQYLQHRHDLFANPAILPEFELEVVAPPQTLAPATGGYVDWEQAFEGLKAQVLERSFDVALLGCGAYGLPLGAAIKRHGRQAIHLGGSLQLLFGIRGRRWDAFPAYQPFFNDAWVRPSVTETPQRARSVDAVRYW